MKISTLDLFFLIILIACTSEPQKPARQKQTSNQENEKSVKKSFLFVGDSLTAGFGIDEATNFVSKIKEDAVIKEWNMNIVNAGISGESSSGTLERVPWLLKSKPNIIFLCTGSNDGLRGTKPELFEQNLRAIINAFQEQHITILLAGIKLPPNLGDDYIKKFEEIPANLAQELNLPFYPFLLKGVAGNADLNLKDGIHPNEKGHELIHQNLKEFLLVHQELLK